MKKPFVLLRIDMVLPSKVRESQIVGGGKSHDRRRLSEMYSGIGQMELTGNRIFVRIPDKVARQPECISARQTGLVYEHDQNARP